MILWKVHFYLSTIIYQTSELTNSGVSASEIRFAIAPPSVYVSVPASLFF